MKKRLFMLLGALAISALGLLVPTSSAVAEDCGGNLIHRQRAFAGAGA